MPVKICLLNDKPLLGAALKSLLEQIDTDFEVVQLAISESDVTEKLDGSNSPDLLILQHNDNGTNYISLVKALRKSKPDLKVMILASEMSPEVVLEYVKQGVKGISLTHMQPAAFSDAIKRIAADELYYPDFVTQILIEQFQQKARTITAGLNPREIEFLRLASTELTYKEISETMCISARTVESYRENLFQKLQIKSRVGLVLFAIKNHLVELPATNIVHQNELQ